MKEKQKLDEAFRNYDSFLKFVPFTIGNDITQIILGEEIMFKRVVKNIGGNNFFTEFADSNYMQNLLDFLEISFLNLIG